jgi:hypothetical protein
MSIVIHTSAGTFIVPDNQESRLVAWLQQNAVQQTQQRIQEEIHSVQSANPAQRHLINE